MENFNLNHIHNFIWKRLSEGVKKSSSPFHLANISTISLSGYPSSRTIVVRGIDKNKFKIFFNTDVRSNKWKELKNNSQVTLHFYDNKLKTQLRIFGETILHYKNNVWKKAWQNTSINSRECYSSPYSPSTYISNPNIIDEAFNKLKKSELNEYDKNFGRVEINIKYIDWLFLKHSGHRRAKFIYKSDEIISKWLAP
tara:strand:- start:12692 stop:13282 length:591 start_codon:yes stop_codon:yes gene_type:complete